MRVVLFYVTLLCLMVSLPGCTEPQTIEREIEVTRVVQVTREIEVTREVLVEREVEVTRVVTATPLPTEVVALLEENSEEELIDATPTPPSLENVVAAAAQQSSQPLACWSWQQAGQYIGMRGCVEGVVSGTGQSQSAFFINFSPDRNSFYLVSFDWMWEEITGECLRVEGTISEFRGRPQIIINNPSAQLRYCGSSDSPPAFAR